MGVNLGRGGVQTAILSILGQLPTTQLSSFIFDSLVVRSWR
jgi:hypothetical protein